MFVFPQVKDLLTVLVEQGCLLPLYGEDSLEGSSHNDNPVYVAVDQLPNKPPNHLVSGMLRWEFPHDLSVIYCGWLKGASCCPGALRAKGEQEANLFVVSVLRPVFVPSCPCLLPVVSRVISFTHWAGTSSYK